MVDMFEIHQQGKEKVGFPQEKRCGKGEFLEGYQNDQDPTLHFSVQCTSNRFECAYK